MKCFYINLDRATSRRQTIESEFAKINIVNIPFQRFAAVDTQYVTEHKIAGGITDVEKACFLSHSTLIKQNVGQSDHIWILEDDQKFASNTLNILGNFLNVTSHATSWDILYTDVGAPNIGTMAELVKLRQSLMSKQTIEFLNLKAMPFFGATSYIINARSLKKVSALLEEPVLNIPFDLLLRKLIYEGKLDGFAIFPFLTTDSDEASISSIQKSEFAQTDLIWSLFRRLTWLDGDSFDPTPLMNEIWTSLDKRSQLYGVLWAAMADPGFKVK